MEGLPLGPGGEDITWPDQVAPRGRKASSTRKIKPQTSNLLKAVAEGFCILAIRVSIPCGAAQCVFTVFFCALLLLVLCLFVNFFHTSEQGFFWCRKLFF